MSQDEKGEATTEMSAHPWYKLRAENERMRIQLTQTEVECARLREEVERSQQELSAIEEALFHPYPQRTMVQAIQEVRVECERRANDWAAAIRAIGERDAELTQLRAAIAAKGVVPDELFARLETWTHQHGEALCPRPGVSDTFGDGMRVAKEEVSSMLAFAIRNWHTTAPVEGCQTLGDGSNGVPASPNVPIVVTSDGPERGDTLRGVTQDELLDVLEKKDQYIRQLKGTIKGQQGSIDKMQKELYGLRHGVWVNRFVEAVAHVNAARKDALEAALRECNDPNIRRGETVNGFSRHYAQRIEKLIREVEAGKSGAEG